MRIGIDSTIFDRFPGYRRGVVVGRGVSNLPADPALSRRLQTAERDLRSAFSGASWQEDARIRSWLDGFRQVGVNPNARPPSVAALVKRVLKGGHLPFINQLVALMNITSLERLVPCGGDDLDTVGRELMLRPAEGTEEYRPLGKSEVVERPDVGEIALVDVAHSIVLCRAWCWRNSDATKLTDKTSLMALNIDLMSPAVSDAEGVAMTQSLAADVRRHCGGEVDWFILTSDHSEARIWE